MDRAAEADSVRRSPARGPAAMGCGSAAAVSVCVLTAVLVVVVCEVLVAVVPAGRTSLPATVVRTPVLAAMRIGKVSEKRGWPQTKLQTKLGPLRELGGVRAHCRFCAFLARSVPRPPPRLSV